jgi:predicted nuclease with TOPRIM domain
MGLHYQCVSRAQALQRVNTGREELKTLRRELARLHERLDEVPSSESARRSIDEGFDGTIKTISRHSEMLDLLQKRSSRVPSIGFIAAALALPAIFTTVVSEAAYWLTNDHNRVSHNFSE